MKALMKTYVAGPIVGFLSSMVMAGLLISYSHVGNSIGDLYAIILGAVVVLAPLLITNVLLSLFYLSRKAPGRTYIWMWAPSLTVLFGQAIVNTVQVEQKQAIEEAHPNIREVHVNLTGQDFWLDPDTATNSTDGAAKIPGDAPEKFISFTRYYGNYYGKEDKMTSYDGARLSDSFHNMRIFWGKPESTRPTILPVNRSTTFPDVKNLIEHMSFKGGESSVIQYGYYHYRDHIDVVPMVTLSGSQSMDLWGSGLPLIEFHIANLGNRALARLEIDGQTIDLGSDAFAPEHSDNMACTSRNFQTYATSHLSAPLKLRWQFAQANPEWHEASVAVPEFKPSTAPPSHIRTTSVDLYFQADGSVVAERSQIAESLRGLTLRTTGPALPLQHKPPCGFAPDRYGSEVTILQD